MSDWNYIMAAVLYIMATVIYLMFQLNRDNGPWANKQGLK